MTSTQKINAMVQDYTLEVVAKAQDATIEGVTAWTEATNEVSAQLPDFTKIYQNLGFVEFTKQFLTAGEEAVGANAEFARRFLTNQCDFARHIFGAVASAAA